MRKLKKPPFPPSLFFSDCGMGLLSRSWRTCIRRRGKHKKTGWLSSYKKASQSMGMQSWPGFNEVPFLCLSALYISDSFVSEWQINCCYSVVRKGARGPLTGSLPTLSAGCNTGTSTMCWNADSGDRIFYKKKIFPIVLLENTAKLCTFCWKDTRLNKPVFII